MFFLTSWLTAFLPEEIPSKPRTRFFYYHIDFTVPWKRTIMNDSSSTTRSEAVNSHTALHKHTYSPTSTSMISHTNNNKPNPDIHTHKTQTAAQEACLPAYDEEPFGTRNFWLHLDCRLPIQHNRCRTFKDLTRNPRSGILEDLSEVGKRITTGTALEYCSDEPEECWTYPVIKWCQPVHPILRHYKDFVLTVKSDQMNNDQGPLIRKTTLHSPALVRHSVEPYTLRP